MTPVRPNWLVVVVLVFALSTSFAAVLPLQGGDDWFDSRALGGHALKLLPDGISLTASRLETIAHAQRSIYISAFSYHDDAAAREITGLLCTKARAGVEVRLLLDHRAAKPFLKHAKALRACGARVLSYNPWNWGITYFRESLHEKLLIVDGEHVILGGSGYANWYAKASRDSLRWHDLDVKVSGPAACWYHHRFIKNWRNTANMEIRPFRKIYQGKHGAEILERLYGLAKFESCKYVAYGKSRVYPLQQNPMFEDGHWLLSAHLAAVHASKHTVTLYSPYFVPDVSLMRALLDARARGVQVTVLTNSGVSSDERATFEGMAVKVDVLLRAGVDLRAWGHPGMLHRKGGVFDGRWAFFGSDNLDRAASFYNSEAISYTDDPVFVRELSANLDEDLRGSTPFTTKMLKDIRRKKSFFYGIYVSIIGRYL